MKIYTKTGDQGETSLVGGTRISKGHEKIEAYGSVDELNCWIGVLLDQEAVKPSRELLISIQENLFTIGSNLALEADSTIDLPKIDDSDISILEKQMDDWNETLPEMRNFVLPGGHPAVSYCHMCRVVCRRAERQVIRLNDNEEVDGLIIRYLNRLSDLFFVFARKMTSDTGSEEIPWRPKKANK
jgi:cob(I)alamin adenosyltransferase